MENGVTREVPTADQEDGDPRSKVKQKAVFMEPERPDELLPGEVTLAHVRSTVKYRLLSERSHGTIGILFVTNYKLSFVAADRSSYDLAGEREGSPPVSSDSPDIPLTRISKAWTTDSGGRRKRLSNDARMSGTNVGSLAIFCKDFLKISFGFKFAKKEDVTLLINSLSVYAFPTAITRVFAFDHAGSVSRRKAARTSVEVPPTSENVPTFRSKGNWEQELARLNASGKWRVSKANEAFALCESLPAFIVCPVTVRDPDLFSAAVCHRHGRIPTWCWSHMETGVALFRGACRKIAEKHNTADKNLRQAMDSSSFWSGKLQVINLDKCCPSTKEFQASFEKLQELCTFESVKDWQSESRWILSLGNTQWMSCVKACLDAASTAASLLHERKDSVLIEDFDGRDLACVVSSLTQMIIDPHFRTVNGFQTLIQKEWVIAGHRFMTRCAHLVGIGSGKKSYPSVQPGSSFSLPRKPAEAKSSQESTWYDSKESLPSAEESLEPKKRGRLSTITSPMGASEEHGIKKSKSFSAAAGNVDDPGQDIKKHSPVFLLFLDCVHQLTAQYPTAFEYTEFFLRHLWTASYSCLYDTFLFDSESDRHTTLDQLSPVTSKCMKMTMMSAWHDVDSAFQSQLPTMKNPLYGLVGWESKFSENPMHTQPTFLDGSTGLYKGKEKHNVPANFRISACLFPNTSQPVLQFWSSCFLQWVSKAHAVNGEVLSSMLIRRQVAEEIQWNLDKPGVRESMEKKSRKEEKRASDKLARASRQYDDVRESVKGSPQKNIHLSDIELTVDPQPVNRGRVFTDPSPRRRVPGKSASMSKGRGLEKEGYVFDKEGYVGDFTAEVMELVKNSGSWEDINPWKKKKEGGSPQRRTSSAGTHSPTIGAH
eukprot:m.35913 g.35913  ORF g.35913 m.35913 type:complete len:881 (+) comp32187_c0_seq17:122-2764(+)